MLRCTILYYTRLCYTVLHSAVLWFSLRYCATLRCHEIQYKTMLYYTKLEQTVLVLYVATSKYTKLYRSVPNYAQLYQYNTLLCCALLFYAKLTKLY